MVEKNDGGESIIKFPCHFTVKIAGKASESFEGEMIRIVRKHFPKLGEGAVKPNQSKKSNYVSLSIELWVESKEPLDALYKDLSENPLVLFTL